MNTIAGLARMDYLEKRFGADWLSRAMRKLLGRKRMKPKTVSALLGCSLPAIYAFCKRQKIPLRPRQTTDTFIYVLRCPISGKVMYVGRSNAPLKRLNGHRTSPSNVQLKEWLASLNAQGLRPVVETVARVRYRYRNWAERAIIKKFLKRGPLLNREVPRVCKNGEMRR